MLGVCTVAMIAYPALAGTGMYNFTVEPVLKDWPNGHTNVVFQDRWSLVTGSVVLKCRIFCLEYLVFVDRWSVIGVVSQDRLHCTLNSLWE